MKRKDWPTWTSGRLTSGRTSSAGISLAGGLLLAPLDRGAAANGGDGSEGPCCWSKSIPRHRPPSGDISLSPSSDMPLENSSMPVCRSVSTVKSTSASRLDVELTVMLEHLRSMPRWVSFRYRISWSWSSSDTEPRRLSHGSLYTKGRLCINTVKFYTLSKCHNRNNYYDQWDVSHNFSSWFYFPCWMKTPYIRFSHYLVLAVSNLPSVKQYIFEFWRQVIYIIFIWNQTG